MSTDQMEIAFDGATFVPELDTWRLNSQITRVWTCCKDGQWRTLAEIAVATGDPEASISARLRDLRKTRFGSHEVCRRHRDDPSSGLYEYRLVPNPRTTERLEMLLLQHSQPF